MSNKQVIIGTSEEITSVLLSGVYAGRRLRVVVEPDADDISEGLSDPPSSVRDANHLEDLLLEGLVSPAREMTSADWTELHERASKRIGGKAS